MLPLDPDVADLAPSDPALTAYNEQHAVTYMRLLDTDAEGADGRDVARIMLRIDPEREPDRARQAFESRLRVGFTAAANVCAATKMQSSGGLAPQATVATVLCDTGLAYRCPIG